MGCGASTDYGSSAQEQIEAIRRRRRASSATGYLSSNPDSLDDYAKSMRMHGVVSSDDDEDAANTHEAALRKARSITVVSRRSSDAVSPSTLRPALRSSRDASCCGSDRSGRSPSCSRSPVMRRISSVSFVMDGVLSPPQHQQSNALDGDKDSLFMPGARSTVALNLRDGDMF
jgi:hypothetical protein